MIVSLRVFFAAIITASALFHPSLTFAQGAGCITCTKVVVIVDNSGSISSSEFTDMKSSLDAIATAILAIPGTEISIIQYASRGNITHSYDITVPFTNNIINAKAWARAFCSGGTVNTSTCSDNLPSSLAEMRIANIWGAGKSCDISNSSCDVKFLIFTDALLDICGSALINPASIKNNCGQNAFIDYGEYDWLKNSFGAQVTLYHVVNSTGNNQPASGTSAIASVGGSYNGNVDANPTDPEGSGVKPRRYNRSTSFILTGTQVSDVVADINVSTGFDVDVDFEFLHDHCSDNPPIFVNKTTGSPVDQWEWDFGDGNISNEENPTHQYSETGTYNVTLKAMNDEGCEEIIMYPIEFQSDKNIFLPNTFTPNGDGLNDEFLPITLGIDAEGYDFKIFDRWGKLVFHSTQPGEAWNGNVAGELAQIDTYAWRLVALKCKEGETKLYGHVNLIR